MEIKIAKRIFAFFVLFAVLVMGSGTLAYCDDEPNNCIFSKDADRDDYAVTFGWDTSKMDADEWTTQYYLDDMYFVGASNGFGEDVSEYLAKKYPEYYRWDEYYQAYVNREDVDFTNLTDTVEFKRKSVYTKDYFADMVETTKQYLGIKDIRAYGGGAAMAAVARAEVTAPDCMEVPLGSNDVKYNTWYYGYRCRGNNYQWCDVFITWCANECGYLDSGYGEGLEEPLYDKYYGANVNSTFHRFVDDLGFDYYAVKQSYPYVEGGYVPVPGDLVLFSAGGADILHFEHIGIVVEVTEDAVIVVDGNNGHKVQETVYDRSKFNSIGRYRNGQFVHVVYPDTNGAIGVYNFLRNTMGFNDAATVGIMMSMDNESHITADKLERSYCQGFGLCGWTDSDSGGFYRWGALRDFCIENGYTWTSFEGQLWFLNYELTEGASARYKQCYQKLLAIPDTEQGAMDAALTWAVLHQGGGTFTSPSGYGLLMQQRIVSYNAYPDVSEWAENYEGGRSDHELAELGWTGTLFEGTENWTGQRRDLSSPPTHWF